MKTTIVIKYDIEDDEIVMTHVQILCANLRNAGIEIPHENVTTEGAAPTM